MPLGDGVADGEAPDDSVADFEPVAEGGEGDAVSERDPVRDLVLEGLREVERLMEADTVLDAVMDGVTSPTEAFVTRTTRSQPERMPVVEPQR